MTDAYSLARVAIDTAHAADPDQRDGRPVELGYAESVELWVLKLDPSATAVLRLAARSQHLERWTLPRANYPMDRAGYLDWRAEQHRRQGARARAICMVAGMSAGESERVGQLVAKRLMRDPDGQTLEDAVCLVFLEREIVGFAAQHTDYPTEKFIDILRKTLRKMSGIARKRATDLEVPAAIAELITAAAAGLQESV